MSSGFDQMSSWSRDVRFASGCILMVFATTHFLNHALGIFGLATMEAAQDWRYWFWHSWIGTVALYGSLLVHPVFALLRVPQRHLVSAVAPMADPATPRLSITGWLRRRRP